MAFMTNQNALNTTVPNAHPHDHGHGHDHSHGHAHAHAETACCGNPVCGSSPAAEAADIPKGALLFRIPTMDCAVEESEIRRALEPVAGVKALRFRLGERTMAITTDDGALPGALDAIRKAGFKPEQLVDTVAPAAAPARIAGMRTGTR